MSAGAEMSAGASRLAATDSGQQDGDDPRQEDPVERAGPADRGDGGAEALDLAQVEKDAADEGTQAARDVGERRGRGAWGGAEWTAGRCRASRRRTPARRPRAGRPGRRAGGRSRG